jgi:LysR family transcriptional regulator, nod-box dependent transcriptional activator
MASPYVEADPTAKLLRLQRFDLNLLLSLRALLHARNVTLAGERIGITQPAMSADLRRLRQMLGDELLVRVGREYQLTPLARDLVEPLDHALSEIELALTHRPTFDPATAKRRFTLMTTDYGLLVLMPAVIRRLLAEAPGVTVHTHPLAVEFERLMLNGEVDLVLGSITREVSDVVHAEVLYTDRWVCAVSADHPDLPADGQMPLDLFERLPHIEWAMGEPPVHSNAESFYEHLGLRRWVVMTTESFSLMPQLIRGTPLVALVHERLARQHTGLVLLDPPIALPQIHQRMYWSAQVATDPAHVWLRRILREVAGALQ